MTDEIFWSIIDDSRKRSKGDQEAMCAALRIRLASLQPAEVVSFDRIFNEKVAAADRIDILAAAYLMDGGCSDDSFEYFRRWLVGMGPAVYEPALSNPDSLAASPSTHLTEGYHDFEQIASIAGDVFQTKTGEEIPYHDGAPFGDDAAGEEFNLDDPGELKARFPNLWKKFGR